MLPTYVKPCRDCGTAFTTVNMRDRLCPNCRLDRELDRIDNYYPRRKAVGYWRRKARTWRSTTALT